ncbi:DEAD/DEAH box helicase [Actinomyces bowdenii]|uniref:DEAD/DEAH box helicase n=1 Tax=Actinomyces bowdenii TaxID=131109 RepID=UPI001C899A16|nr:DEAD/DEAH box helicase family protein [Actinomyces bowdenii]
MRTGHVWATTEVVGKNTIRQLLVPAHDELDYTDDSRQYVHSRFGCWPAASGLDELLGERLAAVLPQDGASGSEVTWVGSRSPVPADVVRDSFEGAIGFTSHTCPCSLRRPQIGALHSIVGYQSSGLTEPGIVVMPTGTGKTETMLAWLVAQRPERVLVVVPSSALREQIASKFETLGILQQEGIVGSGAMRPRVGRVAGRFNSEKDAVDFVAACNVVVVTPNAVHASETAVRRAFFSGFTHLLVDEAHHAPAQTWTEIIRAFGERPVLLFTATPYRRDGLTLPGRVIFRFPLREAQREGYFSKIDFTAVLDLDDDDEALARAALSRLRSDLNAGHEHLLLARVGTKSRADEIHALYLRLAPEFAPKVIYDSLRASERDAAIRAMRERSSRVIVCVDMLGEGFDLPTLKVGAFHDTHRSLSPMVQLIGRLARTSSPVPIGTASVFILQDPKQALSPLRFLLREDPDWDKVLSDITERATERVDEISEFAASFTDNPPDVPVGLLEPKMSARAFATTTVDWDPLAARAVYGDRILDSLISVDRDDTIAWFVIETVSDLRWGNIPSLRATDYTLVVLFLDRMQRLLYVHCSDTKRNLDDLVEAVLGHEPMPVKDHDTFKVFAKLDRLVPTNIGLLDARDRGKRFSMHVGSDVETALTEAERTHKTNTHVAAKALQEGERITIAAALSGRFWSMRTASNLAEWRRWCRDQGEKLRDRSIDVRSLFRDMIIPVDVKERPPYPFLAVEWPWELYLGSGTSSRVTYNEDGVPLTDAGLRVDDYGVDGPLRFSVVTPTWELPYEGRFGSTGVHYRALGGDATIEGGRGSTAPLSTWLNNHKPTLLLSGDRLITGGDRLLAPRTELSPYPRDQLCSLEWTAEGVDITVESQGRGRRKDSIQAFMARYLAENQTFDVLIDDDRSGEAADLVGIRVSGGDLHVTLVHCKYSSKPEAGSRLADLYEVCGQAMRGARWRDNAALPLLEHLHRRTAGYERRFGGSAFEIGDRKALFRIRQQAPLLFPRFTTIIAQPGLSVRSASDEQLRLLAGTASYVQTVTKGGFEVYGST